MANFWPIFLIYVTGMRVQILQRT